MNDFPDKITFRIGEGRDGVSASKLIAQLKGFVAALIELDIRMSKDQKKTSRWMITEASYNSPLTISLAPRPLKGRVVNSEVPRAFVRGVEQLQNSSAEPPNFTPRIMRATKKFLETSAKSGGGLTISGPGGETVQPTGQSIKHINEALKRRKYKTYTTIEGKLDTIDFHKVFKFIVYDTMTDEGTKCAFSSELAEKVRRNIGRRVAVTGMATYNRSDQPFSMEVDDLSEFGDSNQLPKFRDGEEIRVIGDVDAVEFIRRGRDEE